mmetsp:Transcript_4762/g.9132  ORF Transcript_4762/g.9132 Transcript_4762/m.9132 type:complete len:108 (+) Transcript_4762:201-524(+)
MLRLEIGVARDSDGLHSNGRQGGDGLALSVIQRALCAPGCTGFVRPALQDVSSAVMVWEEEDAGSPSGDERRRVGSGLRPSKYSFSLALVASNAQKEERAMLTGPPR